MTRQGEVSRRAGAFVVASVGSMLLGALFLSVPGPAGATPMMQSNCTACHLNDMSLPAAHPLISRLTDNQCATCHGDGDATPLSVAAGSSVLQSQSQFQSQSQEHQRIRTQDQKQVQEQEQAQERRALRLGTIETLDYLERHAQDRGSNADGPAPDPFSFKITAGVLASSNIDTHRTGALFHGSTSHFGGLCGTRFWRHTHSDEDGDGAGNRVHIGLRGDYTTELNGQDRMILGFALNRDRFPEESLGRTSASLRAAFQRRTDTGNLRATAVLHKAAYDGAGSDAYHDHVAIGLNLNYHHRLSASETLSTCFRLRRRIYEDESDFRNADFSGSMAYSRKRDGGGRHGVGFALTDRNNPAHESNRYFAPSFFAVADMPLSPGIMGQLSAEAGLRNYDAADHHTGTLRRDEVYDLGASILFTDISLDASFVRVSCHYTRTNSNIEEEESNDTYCAAMLETQF